MTNDWLYEPCSPEDYLSPTGHPYPHAVRGLKPAGRRVTGYGQTEPDAYTDARQKAREFDARETLGERGEVRQETNIYAIERFYPDEAFRDMPNELERSAAIIAELAPFLERLARNTDPTIATFRDVVLEVMERDVLCMRTLYRLRMQPATYFMEW